MTIYLTETDLVRALANELRRASDGAEDIAADVALALGLSALESSAVRDAVVLSEQLDRAAIDLRGQSLEIDDLDLTPVTPSARIGNFREPK